MMEVFRGLRLSVLGDSEADASYNQQEEVEACIQSESLPEDPHGGTQAAGIDGGSTRHGAVLEFSRVASGGAHVLLSITQPCQVSMIIAGKPGGTRDQQEPLGSPNLPVGPSTTPSRCDRSLHLCFRSPIRLPVSIMLGLVWHLALMQPE